MQIALKFYYPEIRYELYNIVTDPEENNELSENEPELLAELSSALDEMLAGSNAIPTTQGK